MLDRNVYFFPICLSSALSTAFGKAFETSAGSTLAILCDSCLQWPRRVVCCLAGLQLPLPVVVAEVQVGSVGEGAGGRVCDGQKGGAAVLSLLLPVLISLLTLPVKVFNTFSVRLIPNCYEMVYTYSQDYDKEMLPWPAWVAAITNIRYTRYSDAGPYSPQPIFVQVSPAHRLSFML